ncbi:MAG: 4-(cytidine 5'-diphospho)-2-C-methyl-D-erythritol kinase [Candidatus Riflebacteria bacterium]|nr:4-(cytidine 5'-diphospho)-2-C-methyl-D-erythritol kinase [Candidatus Riflebacteria bacterium]
MKRTLILQAPAKINIALWVKEKRPDGFHEIASVMQTITLTDSITLQEIREDGIFVECDDPRVPLGPDNLVHKAARLFLERFKLPSALLIRIQKRIPIAAGLAGGSTDAAAVLKGLMRMYAKGISSSDLTSLSQSIGSDVPFVLRGGCALATGRGEILAFHEPPNPPFTVVIAVPKGISVSTQWCYQNYSPGDNKEKEARFGAVISAFRRRDLSALREYAFNDLESVTLEHHPEVAVIKKTLESEGKGFVLMSGSGPSVFGLFDDKKTAIQAASRLSPDKVDVFLEHTTRSSGL